MTEHNPGHTKEPPSPPLPRRSKKTHRIDTNPFKPEPPPPRKSNTVSYAKNRLAEQSSSSELPGNQEHNPFTDNEDTITIFQETSPPEPSKTPQTAFENGLQAFTDENYDEALKEFKYACQHEPDPEKKKTIQTIAAKKFDKKAGEAIKGVEYASEENDEKQRTSLMFSQMAHEVDPEDHVYLENMGANYFNLLEPGKARIYYTLALKRCSDPEERKKIKEKLDDATAKASLASKPEPLSDRSKTTLLADLPYRSTKNTFENESSDNESTQSEQIIYQNPPQEETSHPEPSQTAQAAWKQGVQAINDKNYDEALGYFKSAYENEPDPKEKEKIKTTSSDMFNTRGKNAYVHAKGNKKNNLSYKEALKMFEYAHDIDRENHVYLYNIGSVYFKLSDYEQAEKYYTLALEKCSNLKQGKLIEKKLERINKKSATGLTKQLGRHRGWRKLKDN